MSASDLHPSTTMSQATGGSQRSRRRLMVAALWILAGLLIEALSLLWNSPRGFLSFLFGGGLLTAVGVLLYLREALFSK